MSRLGLLFCAPYASFVVACIGLATLGDADYQARTVLLQLPVALQMLLACWLGLEPQLSRITWLDAWSVLVPPALLLLYSAGALIERRIERRRAVPPPGQYDALS